MTSARWATHLLEERRGLPEDVSSLLQLPLLFDEGLPTRIHLPDPVLVLLELEVELVDGLRASRSDRDERWGRVETGDVNGGTGDGGDLGAEESESSVHLVKSADVADEGTLEGIDVRVELEKEARSTGVVQSQPLVAEEPAIGRKTR